jgi:hypothetical protein
VTTADCYTLGAVLGQRQKYGTYVSLTDVTQCSFVKGAKPRTLKLGLGQDPNPFQSSACSPTCFSASVLMRALLLSVAHFQMHDV